MAKKELQSISQNLPCQNTVNCMNNIFENNMVHIIGNKTEEESYGSEMKRENMKNGFVILVDYGKYF